MDSISLIFMKRTRLHYHRQGEERMDSFGGSTMKRDTNNHLLRFPLEAASNGPSHARNVLTFPIHEMPFYIQFLERI
jgi:hypothetical protein